MKRIYIAAALAITAALICTPAAHAGWKMDRAIAIAQTVWHPTCGQHVIQFGTPPAEVEGAGGWATPHVCIAHVSNQRHWEFEQLCVTVLHEAGHVAGMEHIDDRLSIMNSSTLLTRAETVIHGRKIVTWPGLDRRCLNRGRTYLTEHGVSINNG